MRNRSISQLESTTFYSHFRFGKAVGGLVVAILGATILLPSLAESINHLVAGKLAELIAGALIGLGFTLLVEEFWSAKERQSSAEHHNNLLKALRSASLPAIRSAFDLGVILAQLSIDSSPDMRKRAMSFAKQLHIEEVVNDSIDRLRKDNTLFSKIKVEMSLYNPPDCADSLLAGYAIAESIRSKEKPKDLQLIIELARKGLDALFLQKKVTDYIVQCLVKYNEGTCDYEAWRKLAMLFVAYIDNVHSGLNSKVAAFFEKERPPIDRPGIVTRLDELLQDFMASPAI